MKKSIKISIVAVLLTFICVNVFAIEANAFTNTDNTETISSTSVQSDLNALSTEVDALVKRVESAKPAGNADMQHKQFLTLHHEMDRLDKKIDILEDKAKADYTSGTSKWEEYRNIERKLDVLEERLDRAEDKLERIFGIDD